MDRLRQGYRFHETASIYVEPEERYVVSLIVGYSDEDCASSEEAARAALELVTEIGAGGTRWFVYDRKADGMLSFEQKQFDPAEG
jgi:hypothetical protein